MDVTSLKQLSLLKKEQQMTDVQKFVRRMRMDPEAYIALKRIHLDEIGELMEDISDIELTRLKPLDYPNFGDAQKWVEMFVFSNRS